MTFRSSHRRRIFGWIASTGAVLGAAYLIVPASGLAQSASTVTPETFQPELQRLDGAIVFSGATGTEAPPGAERIGITLSGVQVEGGLAQMAAPTAALRARLTRGRIPVSDLFEAVGALEAAYAEAGYVLFRVALPQQTLRDGGVLQVVVINGFVETVDTSVVPPEIRGRVQTLTQPLVGDRTVTLADLERQLLLAGDVAGVSLGSALTAGQQPGGTVIMLDPEFRKVTGFVGADSHVADELGGYVLNGGVEFNSPFGLGETFYGRVSASPHGFLSDDPRYRIFAVGAVFPLGPSGLSLNVELTTSDTTPDDNSFETRSDFDRQSVRLIYPWVRSRKLNVTTQIALDRQQDKQALIAGGGDTPIYEDRSTILRGAASVNRFHDDGAFSEAGLVLSLGLDALDARSARDADGDVPLSRQGADADFTKLTLSGFHQRPLSERLMLTVTGRYQTSFGDPLVTAEQISISGGRELSAFDSGELRGDSGWLARSELAWQQPAEISATPVIVAPYLFAGVGAVRIERPTAVENDYENAHAFGLGVDVISQDASRFRSSSLRVELARGARDHGSDDARFSISGNFRF